MEWIKLTNTSINTDHVISLTIRSDGVIRVTYDVPMGIMRPNGNGDLDPYYKDYSGEDYNILLAYMDA